MYLSVHHPDILQFLDTKRENADEKIRIKTLSLGVVITDIFMQKASEGKDVYTFSPYDVERIYGVPFSEVYITEKYDEMVADERITKVRIDPRKFLQTLATIQFESGYPYVMFEDNVNTVHNIKGKVQFSNICVEISQVSDSSEIDPHTGQYTKVGRDISCNLASLDIAKAVDGKDIAKTVNLTIRALTAVSDQTDLAIVPTIQNGNAKSHAVGLGFMNLHGFLAREEIYYGSEEALDFVSAFTSTVRYHAIKASNELAKEKNKTFYEFEESKYATGEAFDKYVTKSWEAKTDKVKEVLAKFGFSVPTIKDWENLKYDVMNSGMYNAYLMAVAPTGSISYVRNATSSVHPIISLIETRKEGLMGRVYTAAPFLTNDNKQYYVDAYELGYEKLIDMYAAMQEHIDQGMSLTLYFKEDATTRDLNRAQIYAWRKGIKTLYYTRLRKQAIEGTDDLGCVSCSI